MDHLHILLYPKVIIVGLVIILKLKCTLESASKGVSRSEEPDPGMFARCAECLPSSYGSVSSLVDTYLEYQVVLGWIYAVNEVYRYRILQFLNFLEYQCFIGGN